jgi:hypothetical protein
MRAFADSSATDRARSGGDSSAVHHVCFPLKSSTHDSLREPRIGSVIENSPSPSRWRDASALRLDQRVRCEYVGVRVPRQLLLRHLLEHGFWTPVLESALTQQLFPEIAWRQTGKAASTWIATTPGRKQMCLDIPRSSTRCGYHQTKRA